MQTNLDSYFIFTKFIFVFRFNCCRLFIISSYFATKSLISEVEDMVTGLMQKISGKWTCLTCNLESRDKTDLRRHIEAKHINAEVICPVCFSHYKTRESFAKHMTKMHVGVAFV